MVLLGGWAEFALPLALVLGLFTRLAALGMIGFVMMQSLTDIYGHLADPATIGAWFDRASDALILDQRALWVVLAAGSGLQGRGPPVAGRRAETLGTGLKRHRKSPASTLNHGRFQQQNPPTSPLRPVFALDFRLTFGMICPVTTLSDRLPDVKALEVGCTACGNFAAGWVE